MPRVTYLASDGSILKTVDAQKGETLLKIALDNGVAMEHACGGNGFCTTCMCSVKEDPQNLSPRNDREENMGVTDDPHRLGCQARAEGDTTVQLQDF